MLYSVSTGGLKSDGTKYNSRQGRFLHVRFQVSCGHVSNDRSSPRQSLLLQGSTLQQTRVQYKDIMYSASTESLKSHSTVDKVSGFHAVMSPMTVALQQSSLQVSTLQQTRVQDKSVPYSGITDSLQSHSTVDQGYRFQVSCGHVSNGRSSTLSSLRGMQTHTYSRRACVTVVVQYCTLSNSNNDGLKN